MDRGGSALLDLLAHLPDVAIIRYASPLQDPTVLTDYQPKPSIRARSEDILHVFVNVMTNAIHAMDGRGTLSMGTSWVGEKAKVSISDTGCGIPKEHVDQVFEPFFTTKSPERGTGLVESEAGKGTTFHLDFPEP